MATETDPMLALRRARHAWERSQPQLIIPEFWGNEGGLEPGEVKRADITSPPWSAAASPDSSPPNPREADGASEHRGRRARQVP